MIFPNRRTNSKSSSLMRAPSRRPVGQGAAPLERSDERDLVGILEVATDGDPASDAGHAPDPTFKALVEIHGRGLALERRVRGQDDLDEPLPFAIGGVDPVEQLSDLEAVGADAIDRRDGPVEDVIAAPELARPLEGEDVERLLDHAQASSVAARVAADRAQRLVADVEALVAEDDLLPHGDERGRERPGLRIGRAEE